MSAQRIAMRKIREVLRLRLSAGLSIRQISAGTKISVGSIQTILKLAEQHQLCWPLPDELDDQALALTLYPSSDARPAAKFQQPVWSEIHQELRKKGVTKQLLWEEYTRQYPNRCYSYSQFCARYADWLKAQKRSMRQTHRAGDKLFIDYAGPTVPIICTGGEIRPASIFVAVLGASSYTYAEATWSQSLPDWLGSHVRAFEFFDGCPALLVPDNLRSGVSKACRYEPELNPAYQQLAAHYEVAVLPARPYKPKDKAKAEVGVQLVERWILARLRHQTFFSLAELNQCIQALLIELNDKPFKQWPGNRRQWFEQLDRPALAPLPKHAYRYIAIKTVRVPLDYHVPYEQHWYSVPHHCVGEPVEIHAGERLIEVYFHNRCLATHVRQFHPGTTTEPTHRPEKHAQHQQWTPGRLMNWAQTLGPEVLRWVKTQLNRQQHPEQAYRVCLGLLNLQRSYPPERLNRACALANQAGLYRLKNIKAILHSNRDQLPETLLVQPSLLPQDHENIRGPKSFH
ncbi:IS21 family transposase [Methylobacter sp. sgz302048]|uniref:IS21 family transposase n=1 Tax=Methylobacter sp. sgz302048 TaxID=3455945 RepID=UPI003FA008BF